MQNIKDLNIDKPWIDFSSLSMLMKCPRQYYWKIIREITSSGEQAPLINGEAYHECKATYLRMKKAGQGTHEERKDAALESMIPIMSQITGEDPKRNLTVAFSTMNNYLDFWKDEPYEILEVEVKFAVDMISFIFVGRIDAIKMHPSFGKLVEETKTTSIVGKKWEYRVKPNLQIDGYYSAMYILTGEAYGGGILDVIPVDEKLKAQPMRFITPRNIEDVKDWTNNIQEWWMTLDRYKKSGIFPQNTEACYPILGYNCEYTTLCSMYPHPYDVQEIELPGEYCISSWAPFEDLKKIERRETT